MRHLRLSLLVALLGTACGGSGGRGSTGANPDSSLAGFLVVLSNCAEGPPSALYYVTGFSDRLLDSPSSPSLVAQAHVGETVEMNLRLAGCGFTNGEVWLSTDAQVASVATAQYSFVARFTALAPGTTTVYVDFNGPDGKRHRTTLGACPINDPRYPWVPDMSGCSNPQLIGSVVVVP